MRTHKVKHSKLRNTGILFECLLRQLTADVLSKEEKSKAVDVIKEVFNESTELGKELALYNVLISRKFKTDTQANYFINEALKSRTQLNNTDLKREKYNLIKTLKENFDVTKLLSSKIKNYKVYASIYKLFEFKLKPEIKTENYFNLVEHITTKNNSIKLSETVGSKIPDEEDIRILTYKTLLEKFNQKYTKLSGDQKNLLREFINNVSNTNSLKDTLKELVKGLKKDLKTHSKNLKDKVVKIKMNEAIKSIDKMCGVNQKSKIVKDSHVVQTMRYLELSKELKKNANSKQKIL
tara:strand:- start:229 stop:1110 length:882 start_codon:yes stop_codon:yes gene_type:complete